MSEMPEIDAVLGVGSFGDIVSAADAVMARERVPPSATTAPPLTNTPRCLHRSGLGISAHRRGMQQLLRLLCHPFIRGRYRSRDMENIIEEARDLAAHGVKELIVIAQDITRYGTDLYGKRCLAELCRACPKIDGIEWIRLHYLYVDQFDEELIDELANNPKIVKYLDIPIQHINDHILKLMNRRGTGDDIRVLFKKLRERIPGLVIRTSLIAGLPGEGEAEFEELCEFPARARIERVGVFPFSPEEGTPAAKMEHVDEEEAQRRADLIMELQAPIMDEFCQGFCGKTIRVLRRGLRRRSFMLYGRSYADSPDIDGQVFFKGSCRDGDMTDVLHPRSR